MNARAATAACLAALFLTAATSRAQTLPEPPRTLTEPLASSYSAEFLRNLPTADNLFNVIDVLQPSIIADRFLGGGLSVGQPARIGGFLTSWTQSLFSIDGVPFTDPTGSGAPMLSPELLLWSRVHVATGAFGADTTAQGLSIDLTPPTPGKVWSGVGEAAFSHGRMNSTGSTDGTPPLTRLAKYDRVGASASGPLGERLGATFAFSGTGAAQFDRRDTVANTAHAFSAFTQFVFTPSADNEIRLLGYGQKTESPSPFRQILKSSTITPFATSGGRGQLTWTHRANAEAPWIVSASYGERRDLPGDVNIAGGIMDRITDGPVSQFADLARRTVRAWSGTARTDRRRMSGNATHLLTLAVQSDGGQLQSSGAFSGAIGELVHGAPARVWQFSASKNDSDRSVTNIAGVIEDRITVSPRFTVRAGVRVEAVSGSAQGAARGISWHSALPRVGAELTLRQSGSLVAFTSYSRSGARLTLDALAFGDPAAPTASVFRWTTLNGYPLSLSERGALISLVGPGTGTGAAALSSIDAGIKRPMADEFVLGLDMKPLKGALFRLAGVTRRETNLLGVVNTGSPAYSTFTHEDPGGDILGDEDDTTLTVYNRLPSSFAKDQYQLTNPGQTGSTLSGIEITLQYQTSHVTFTSGATASIAQTFANSVGYGPLENDQTVLGELFTDPNAGGLAHGRPFTDRAFTGKIATVFRLPAETHLGLIARYQDGQNFSRLVVFPGLNQGAEAVRGFANGDSRFKFVGTLDVRLQKAFRAGARRVDVFIDGYNVTNLRNSVEEDVANAPGTRIDTALQPPLSINAGLRLIF